jgi:hypothetical protein
VVRSAVRIAVMSFALVAAPIAAGATSLVGTWHGLITLNGQHCSIDVVMTADGRYAQTARCGTVMTQQAGTYKVFPNNELGFTVMDWSPKQRYVVGSAVGSGHLETNARPPGGMFKYTVRGPSSMVWRDVNFGGSITMVRG